MKYMQYRNQLSEIYKVVEALMKCQEQTQNSIRWHEYEPRPIVFDKIQREVNCNNGILDILESSIIPKSETYYNTFKKFILSFEHQFKFSVSRVRKNVYNELSSPNLDYMQQDLYENHIVPLIERIINDDKCNVICTVQTLLYYGSNHVDIMEPLMDKWYSYTIELNKLIDDILNDIEIPTLPDKYHIWKDLLKPIPFKVKKKVEDTWSIGDTIQCNTGNFVIMEVYKSTSTGGHYCLLVNQDSGDTILVPVENNGGIYL